MNLNGVSAKNLLRFSVNRRGASKIATALFLTLIILIAFIASWYSGLLPNMQTSQSSQSTQQQEEAKTSISIEEKLTQLVENNPVENPMVPVYFHYLDRYFSGLSEDAFDQAVAAVMSNLTQVNKDAIANLLSSYKQHKDVLAPMIGDFDLELSETVNSTHFATKLVSRDLIQTAYEEPGLVRITPGDEFGPRVNILYINDYWDRNEAVPILPGEKVTLQGCNFCDLNLKIIIRSPTYYNEFSEDQIFIRGDMITPQDAPQSTVRDKITFYLPRNIASGYYELIVDIPHGTDDTRQIVVPPPTDEKYVVRALQVYCEDETNPETIWPGINIKDETFFSFIVSTGDKIWGVVTNDYSYDDETSRNLGATESTIFGPDQGLFADIDTQLRIMVSGYEIDSGDVETAKSIAKTTTDLAKAILTLTGQTDWVPVAGAVGQLIDVIIGLADGQVMVADDEIVWTENDLYFLTAEPRPQTHNLLEVERKRHPGYTEKNINIRGYDLSVFSYTTPSGIEVRVPVYGNYKFYILPEYSQRSFTLWRGYKNNNEPSQYFVKFEVQRQGSS